MRVSRTWRRLSLAALSCAAALSGCSGSGPHNWVTAVPPSPAPTPIAQVHFPAWSGAPGYANFAFLADGDFGYAEVVQNPYNPAIANPVKLYLTYDGGASWVDRTPPPESPSGFLYEDLHFADPLNAWFVENVYATYPDVKEVLLYRTSNGGQTWTKFVVPLPTGYIASDLDMTDGTHGLITTMPGDQGQRQMVWGTSDGGANWALLVDVPSDPNHDFPRQPTMVSAQEGWAMDIADDIGGQNILHSTDGGRSWVSNGPLPLPDDATGVWGIEPASVWAHQPFTVSGTDFSIHGWVEVKAGWEYVVWVSRDAGTTWSLDSTRLMTSAAPRPTYPGVGYAGLDIGAGSIEYFDTKTLGPTAVFDPSSACHGAGFTASVMDMITPKDVWVACSHENGGSVDYRYMYATTDGGKTWTPMMGAPSS